MIAYITVGANDVAKAAQFYGAILPAMGCQHERYHGDLSYIPPGQPPVSPEFYVKSPFDGASATAGNGVMVAFEAGSQEQVRTLHAAALAAGGSDEGQPGFRATYGAHFYVSYLRDPDGNTVELKRYGGAPPSS